jgi:hypothetical protein
MREIKQRTKEAKHKIINSPFKFSGIYFKLKY